MKIKFNDKNIILKFLQIKLKEHYNPDVKVNSTYYTTVNDKYGFTHYIAKYLTDTYPPLDTTAYSSRIPASYDTVRSLTEPISVTNYFLCSNNGDKLRGDIQTNADGTKYYVDPYYEQIYGSYYNRRYVTDFKDPPILCRLENSSDFNMVVTTFPDVNTKFAAYQNIYTLQKWTTPKDKCEIDDYILSYLLGRTITPWSSREDIYYVQKLLIGDIEPVNRGIWNSSQGNLTELIMSFQRSCVTRHSNVPIFVTGYFDIYTEQLLLDMRGEMSNVFYGL